jgi:hypothetical protein
VGSDALPASSAKTASIEQLGKFMELLSAKTPLEQAFQEAFGTPSK